MKVASLALGTVFSLAVALVTPLRAQFVYVANVGGKNVSAFSIDSKGALIPVPGSPFAAGNTPVSVAVDPTGRFVYVANNFFPPVVPSTTSAISAFSIGPNGALTPAPGSPFQIGNGFVRGGPGSMAVDPTGRFLYVTNASVSIPLVGTIFAFSIGPNGALTPVSGSPFAAFPTPVSVAVEPTGRFAYVASRDDFTSTVSSYSIGSNGALTPLAILRGLIDATSVAVDPKGKFIYVIYAQSFNGVVLGYSIGSSGALTELPGHALSGDGSVSVAVDPTGSFLYVANESSNNISAYTIASDGALSPFSGSLFAAGNGPDSVAVDPTGKFAYVVNAGGNVSGYSISSNGALTPVLGSPFPAGLFPRSVAITPFVPFASSFEKLEIEVRHRPGFDLLEFFTLSANSNGINPVTEEVTLQIGSFSVTIPADSFQRHHNGRFAFEGVVNGVKLEVQIVPLGNNIFIFKAEGTGVDLSGLKNPVTVVLTIGIDSGATTATAQF